jgi:hypothetical protein
MFDFEKLAKICREQERWTFFVTSAPANVPGMLFMCVSFLLVIVHLIDCLPVISTGGVSSHGNVVAIL